MITNELTNELALFITGFPYKIISHTKKLIQIELKLDWQKNNDSKSNVRFAEESLNIENTIWCNTVVASGSIIGVTIYTGTHTKTSMNTSIPSTKVCQILFNSYCRIC